MTICIGLLARDGVVIAADSEESDRYLKRAQRKILPWFGNLPIGDNPKPIESVCLFTGAGDAWYIDAFTHQAIKGLQVGKSSTELESYLEGELRAFYKKHIFPWASPPEFQMLVGAFCRYDTSIFVSHGSTIRRAMPHAAIGIGASFAMSLLDLLPGIEEIKRTEVLAAYVIASTKDRVEGCGKYTTIMSLRSSSIVDTPGEPSKLVPPARPMSSVNPDLIERWEESFRTKWASRQATLVRDLVEEELA